MKQLLLEQWTELSQEPSLTFEHAVVRDELVLAREREDFELTVTPMVVVLLGEVFRDSVENTLKSPKASLLGFIILVVGRMELVELGRVQFRTFHVGNDTYIIAYYYKKVHQNYV